MEHEEDLDTLDGHNPVAYAARFAVEGVRSAVGAVGVLAVSAIIGLIGAAATIAVAGFAKFAIAGWLVMLVAPLVGVHGVSYWQALGLAVVAVIVGATTLHR